MPNTQSYCTSSSQQLRQKLRQQIRQRRQAISHNEQTQAALQLKNQLSQHPKVKAASNIAIYLANDGELNTLPFIQWCWQQQKNVYLPVLHPFSAGYLLFFRYKSTTTMCYNRFGIKEPKLDITQMCLLNNLDIIFTPLVAFDNSGNRLGMGGGFYDRTLSSWQSSIEQHPIKKQLKSHSTLTPIGLAHDCQQVNSIPQELWDIPLPEIITPTTTFHF